MPERGFTEIFQDSLALQEAVRREIASTDFISQKEEGGDQVLSSS